MEGIGKGRGAAYGRSEVERALEAGAVEVLMISESAFREGWGRILMTRCKETGSKGMIISTSHEAGDMLRRIGGAGALLRYEF
jgi:protein pelota